jgi:hypothetical protein
MRSGWARPNRAVSAKLFRIFDKEGAAGVLPF